MSALIARLTQADGLITAEELVSMLNEARLTQDAEAEKAVAAVLRDSWATPHDLFLQLHARHGFTVDTSAEPWNAKLTRWFGPGGVEADGLKASWAGERWFANWPFSRIAQWLPYAWSWYSPQRRQERRMAGVGCLVVPATRTEQDWWARYIEPYRDKPAVWKQIGCELHCEFLRKRTHYLPPPGVPDSSPKFGSCVLTWIPLI